MDAFPKHSLRLVAVLSALVPSLAWNPVPVAVADEASPLRPAVVSPAGTAPPPSPPQAAVAVDPTCSDIFTPDELPLCVHRPSSPDTVALTGRVLDEESLRPVPEATVRLSSGGETATAVSDEAGQFAFAGFAAAVSSGGDSTIKAVLRVQADNYGTYEVRNHRYAAGEGYGVAVLLTPGAHSKSLGEVPDGTGSEPGAAPASLTSPYPSHSRIPPVIRVAPVYDVFARGGCTRDNPIAHSARVYHYRFYVTHVLGPEIGGELGKMTTGRSEYLRANAAAAANYAWRKRTDGSPIDNTTYNQCFDPDYPVPEWWAGAIEPALRHRVVHDGRIQLTEYKGYGSGTHDSTCRPPFVLGSTYQLSQVEARYCADTPHEHTWDWIIRTYYNYGGATGWTLSPGLAPATPTASAEPGGSGEVTLRWDSLGTWYSHVWRWNAYREQWFKVWEGGWSSGCRCVRRSWTESNLVPGATYHYAVAVRNPVGWSLFTYPSAEAGA